MVLNLILALVVGLLVLTFVLIRLNAYTNHGVEVEVPDVVGFYLEEAAPLLAAEHLKLVVVDSTYSRRVPLGTIVEQNPPSHAHVKHERAVYVVVNARQRRVVVMPDLVDASFRQAVATLRQLDIIADSICYEPSEYKDLVLDVRRGGESVMPGDRLEEGTHVILVVGRGKGSEQVEVPNLKGKSLIAARSLLMGLYLTPGEIRYDVPPTDDTRELYVVYSQSVEPGTMCLEGTRVDISLSTDIEKAVTYDNANSEEDFF